MHHYRVYCLDAQGKIRTAEWVRADTIEQAIELASEQCEGASEIWDGAKRLAELPGAQPSAQSASALLVIQRKSGAFETAGRSESV